MKRAELLLGIAIILIAIGLISAATVPEVSPPSRPLVMLSTGEDLKRTVLRAAGTASYPEGEDNEAKALLKARSSARRAALLQLAHLVGFRPLPEDEEYRFKAELKGARTVDEKYDQERRTVTVEMEIPLDTLLGNLVRQPSPPPPSEKKDNPSQGCPQNHDTLQP